MAMRRRMMDDRPTSREVNNKDLWKWMFSYIKTYKKVFMTCIILLFILTGITAVLPKLQQLIIDEYIIPNSANISQDIANLNKIMILYITVFFGAWGGTGVINYFIGRIGTIIISKIREDCFENVQNMSMDYFDKQKSGEIISIVTNDVDQLQFIFGGMLSTLLADVFKGVIVLVLMFSINWELSMIAILMIPIMLFAANKLTKSVRTIFKQSRKEISKVTQVAEQNISGVKVILQYGKQFDSELEFDKVNKSNRKVLLRARKIFAYLIPAIMFISYFFMLMMAYYGGFGILNGVSILGGVVTIGDLTALNTYMMQILMPAIAIGMFKQMSEPALAAAERIYLLLNEENSIPEPRFPVELKNRAGHIQFNDVVFGYSKRKSSQELLDKQRWELSPKELKKMKTDLRKQLMQLEPKERKEVKKYLEALPKEQQNFVRSLKQDQRENLLGIPNEFRSVFIEKGAEGNLKIYRRYASRFFGLEPQFRSQFISELLKKSKEKQMEILEVFMHIIDAPDSYLIISQKLDYELMMENSQEKHDPRTDLISTENPLDFKTLIMQMNIPRDYILDLLSSPEVPLEISKQFSNEVKKLLKEKVKSQMVRTGPVIKGVEIDIPAGKTIAFVGETGAGKSTLIKLISRFYDIPHGNGYISIDDIPIKEMKKIDLRSLIGMVPQDSFLFTGTILENLFYGVSDRIVPKLTEDVLKITKHIGLDEFIQNLPEKYETKLIEGGSNLSVGQKQLICFARVLMTDPKILILDEATSSIDPYTERIIQQAVEKISENRTTIIIAHRLSTIRHADIIYVMDDGKVLEHGTHQELMKLGGHYADLVNIQKNK